MIVHWCLRGSQVALSFPHMHAIRAPWLLSASCCLSCRCSQPLSRSSLAFTHSPSPSLTLPHPLPSRPVQDVRVRYSLDGWRSWGEVSANWDRRLGLGADNFNFLVDLDGGAAGGVGGGGVG